MGYFSAVAPGTQTLAQGIFSTPSYLEKAGAPYSQILNLRDCHIY